MLEPVTKEEWRLYFLEKLERAQRRVEEAQSDEERAELESRAEDLRRKIRLLDFDARAWWPRDIGLDG